MTKYDQENELSNCVSQLLRTLCSTVCIQAPLFIGMYLLVEEGKILASTLVKHGQARV